LAGIEETTSEQITIPAIGELLTQNDSVEQANITLINTDTKELYQELQKIRYSIEMAFENTQMLSDDEKRKLSSVSLKIHR
jgi:hypothetical protein